MRRFSVSVLMVLLCVLLVSCETALPTVSQPPNSDFTAPSLAPSPAIEADEGQLVLKTVSMFGGTDPNAGPYNTLSRQFAEAHPHVKLMDNSSVSTESWKTKVAADFANGNEPDVIYFFTDKNAANVLASDPFVSIEEIRAVYPDYAADITEKALESAASPGGTQLAVPTTGFYEGLFCNKDLFDQYNLELPTDWDKLMTAITVFRENKVIPIAVSLAEVPHYWIEHLILSSAGVEGHRQNPKTPPADWVAGLSLFQTLREAGAFPTDTDILKNADIELLFRNKQAAMQLDGSWYAGGVPDQVNTVILPFPVIPGGKKEPGDILTGFSSGFYITRKAWDDPLKRDLAVQFVMTHTTREAIAEYWSGAGMPSAQCDPPEGLSPLLQSGAEMADKAKNTDNPIDSRLNPEAWKSLVREISGISNGVTTAEKALTAALAKN